MELTVKNESFFIQLSGMSYQASFCIMVDDDPIVAGVEWSVDRHMQAAVATMVIQLVEGQHVWVSPYFTAGAKVIWGEPSVRHTWLGATLLYPS